MVVAFLLVVAVALLPCPFNTPVVHAADARLTHVVAYGILLHESKNVRVMLKDKGRGVGNGG